MADSIPSPYSETTKKHTRSRLAGGLVYRARVTDPQAPFSLHAAPRAHNLNACIAKTLKLKPYYSGSHSEWTHSLDTGSFT